MFVIGLFARSAPPSVLPVRNSLGAVPEARKVKKKHGLVHRSSWRGLQQGRPARPVDPHPAGRLGPSLTFPPFAAATPANYRPAIRAWPIGPISPSPGFTQPVFSRGELAGCRAGAVSASPGIAVPRRATTSWFGRHRCVQHTLSTSKMETEMTDLFVSCARHSHPVVVRNEPPIQ